MVMFRRCSLKIAVADSSSVRLCLVQWPLPCREYKAEEWFGRAEDLLDPVMHDALALWLQVPQHHALAGASRPPNERVPPLADRFDLRVLLDEKADELLRGQLLRASTTKGLPGNRPELQRDPYRSRLQRLEQGSPDATAGGGSSKNGWNSPTPGYDVWSRPQSPMGSVRVLELLWRSAPWTSVSRASISRMDADSSPDSCHSKSVRYSFSPVGTGRTPARRFSTVASPVEVLTGRKPTQNRIRVQFDRHYDFLTLRFRPSPTTALAYCQ